MCPRAGTFMHRTKSTVPIRRPPVPSTPRPVRVKAPEGTPVAVDGRLVELVIEDWLVEDRWWTEHPIRRRYWEVVTGQGHCLVIYHDVIAGAWYTQAA